MIQNQFIAYSLNIKGNTPYPILLIEFGMSPIESTTIFRYLMYKKKLYSMESKNLPKISSKFSQNHHLRLRRGWHKDAQSWLNHWGIEELKMGSKDSVKITITSKV